MGPDRFWFFGFKALQKCKICEIWTIFRYCKMRSKFYYITHLRDMGENSKINFFQVFTLYCILIFIMINIHYKCDLLRYIMLMQLKNSEDWRRAINANFAKMAPLPIFQFLSYINIIYLKRTDFSHRIRIQEKISQSQIQNFEKIKFFRQALFTQVRYIVKL